MRSFPTLPLANLELWLTPLWLLSVGVTAGVVVLAVLFGIMWLVSPKRAQQTLAYVQEGVLMPISYVVLAMVALSIVAIPIMPVARVADSLGRLSQTGQRSASLTAEPQDVTSLPVRFDSDELRRYTITSDQDVTISLEQNVEEAVFDDDSLSVEVQGDVPLEWTATGRTPRVFQGEVAALYVQNLGDAPAKVRFDYTTEVRIPQVRQIPIVAASVIGVYLLYLSLIWLLPAISNVAVATSKEAMGQPLFALFLAGGVAAMLLFIVLPYNTFGEDVKMLKDSGLSTIMILAIIFALWTASVSIADEIEGKTALTLLSKPISRRQFILGKFSGIVWPVLVMFVILGVVLMATVSYKVVYDARETSNPTPEWQLCYETMIGTVPGLVLAFMEAVVLTAVSVAISTRLPMLPNLVICGSIYVLGHLTPLIVQSSWGNIEFVRFFGKLVAVVLPVLDYFNIQPAVAGGKEVPLAYLGTCLLYCALYSTIAMLAALASFEDRDLA